MEYFKDQRSAIFVDCHRLEQKGQYWIDYHKLITLFKKQNLIRSFVFTKDKNLPDSFKTMLINNGYEIKYRTEDYESCLSITAISLAEKLDTAIFIGGNNSYLTLITHLQAKGVKCVICNWSNLAGEIKKVADIFIPLTSIISSTTVDDNNILILNNYRRVINE